MIGPGLFAINIHDAGGIDHFWLIGELRLFVDDASEDFMIPFNWIYE
jgi:hypothetical protein